MKKVEFDSFEKIQKQMIEIERQRAESYKFLLEEVLANINLITASKCDEILRSYTTIMR